MEPVKLTAEQQAEAERIEDIIVNHELLGRTEFQLRDACHRIGAAAVDAALEKRKKRGTVGRP